MSRLKWDLDTERLFEGGVDQCVLFPKTGTVYDTGVNWNGIVNINESPEGGEANSGYADNIEYYKIRSVEKLKLSIEAYTYPPEFAECDGSAEYVPGVRLRQQTRKEFGLCYRTKIGSDDKGFDKGYIIHVVYGCSVSPTERSHATLNESPEAETMSWEAETTPITFSDSFKPTSKLEFDSTKFTTDSDKEKFKALEDLIYGTDPTTVGGTGTDPTMPMPDDIMDIFGPAPDPDPDPNPNPEES